MEFVNMVTSFLLSCLTEIIDTDLAQVSKPNIRWIIFHLCKNIFDFSHVLYSINIDIYVKVFLVHQRTLAKNIKVTNVTNAGVS